MNYVCTKCHEEKDSSEFYADARNIFKHVRAECKVCLGKIVAARKKIVGYTDADRMRTAKWAKDNRAHVNALSAARILKNPEPSREATRRWDKKYPERRRIVAGRRRARKVMAYVAWADEKEMEKFYAEAQRLTMETGVLHTVDHEIPLAGKEACGLHCEFNLQVLTLSENSSKGNRIPPHLLEWQFHDQRMAA